MDKFYVWLIVALILFSTYSVYAENKQELFNSGSSISETKIKFSVEPTPPIPINEQDFYKATVQAYKDFNEQVVKYIGVALTIVSVFVTGLVILFVFFFNKRLADIRKDIKDDADRVNNVYSTTFELLNKQADANLRIFESRETELQDKIKEAKELIEKIKDIFNKLSEEEKIREPLAEKLGVEEAEAQNKESAIIEKEMDSIREDLEKVGGE